MSDDNQSVKHQDAQQYSVYSDKQFPQPNQLQEESPLISKETSFNPKILAVILFVAISGAVIAYFLKFSKIPSITTPAQIVEQTTSTPIFLSIENPKNEAISVDGEILVSGTTLPFSTVLIYTDTDDTSVEADSEGKFEETILLGKGEKLVSVTAYAESGEEKTVTFRVSSGS